MSLYRCVEGLQRGYLGTCSIDGSLVRVNSFDINLSQETEFHEHTIGLNDYFEYGAIESPINPRFKDGFVGKKGARDGILSHPQKKFWRPGVKSISGSINFFPSVSALKKVFDIAKYGKTFDMQYNYSKKSIYRIYYGCKINTMEFSVSAGENISVTLNIMATKVVEFSYGVAPHLKFSEKLINYGSLTVDTIHKYQIGEKLKGLEIQAFSFSINNSCQPIYTINQNVDKLDERLFPKDLRNGMQNVSGSITYYLVGNPVLNLAAKDLYPYLNEEQGKSYTSLDEKTAASEIKLSIPGDCGGVSFDEKICVVYKPVMRAGGTGVIFQTVPFQGVGFALGK
jgi:hypothetical protein